MRIGMFCDMYKPHTSGITNHVALYKRHFEDLGHDVWVFTFGDRDFHDDEKHVVRSPGVGWGDTGWNFALDHSRRAKSIASTLDIFHVHHPFQSGRIALRIASDRHIPVVMTNHTRHDLYSDAYAGYVPRPLRYAYLQRTLRDVYSRASLVIAPSQGIADWLADLDVCDTIEVIPNGVDTEPFRHPAAPVPRAELDLSETDVVCCYVGRVASEKNSVLLVESFARASESQPSLKLLVVGDGPARGEVERVVTEAGLTGRVRLVGMVPYARIPDFEAAADLFATASVSEVHPLVVLEAMAAGLPIVGVVSPGVADTVADEVTGLLAPKADASAIAARLCRLAEDPGLRARLGAAAQVDAARYDLAHTADLVLKQYQALVASRNRV